MSSVIQHNKIRRNEICSYKRQTYKSRDLIKKKIWFKKHQIVLLLSSQEVTNIHRRSVPNVLKLKYRFNSVSWHICRTRCILGWLWSRAKRWKSDPGKNWWNHQIAVETVIFFIVKLSDKPKRHGCNLLRPEVLVAILDYGEKTRLRKKSRKTTKHTLSVFLEHVWSLLRYLPDTHLIDRFSVSQTTDFNI